MVAVLKTAEAKVSGGSNPSLSDLLNPGPGVRIPPSPITFETIAQLDRASVCGTEGRRFESSWSRKWRDVRVVEGAGLEIRCSALHYRGFESLSLRRDNISKQTSGEVSEWSKVHDWKSCMVESHRGFESPPLRFQQQILGYVRRPTPSGQECSSGKRNVHETETICCCFLFLDTLPCYNQPPEE